MLFAVSLPAEIVQADEEKRRENKSAAQPHNMPVFREKEHQLKGQLLTQKPDFRGIVPILREDSAAIVGQMLGQHQFAGSIGIQSVNHVSVQKEAEDKQYTRKDGPFHVFLFIGKLFHLRMYFLESL